MELPQRNSPFRIFHAVAATFSIFNNNIIFCLILWQLWYQVQVFSGRKWPQWNNHAKPIVKLPLVEWGSAAVLQCPSFLHLLMHLLQFLVLFVSILILCKNLRQILVPSSRANIFEKPVLDNVPVELPCWNIPWPRGAMLQCPSFFALFMHVPAVISFFCS